MKAPKGCRIKGNAFVDCPEDWAGPISIPDGITIIGDGAFRGCVGLTSVQLPDSVVKICEGAFAGCRSLMNVRMPEFLASIGGWAFAECAALTSIHIPEPVAEIGTCAFKECAALTSIRTPPGVKHIRECTFLRCSSLSLAVVHTGTRIDKDAIPETCQVRTIDEHRTIVTSELIAARQCEEVESVGMQVPVSAIVRGGAQGGRGI